MAIGGLPKRKMVIMCECNKHNKYFLQVKNSINKSLQILNLKEKILKIKKINK